MDKITERETRDFMNVDSFSQLPFIRPTPPSKDKPIRLFGKEFSDGPESESTDTTATNNNSNNNNASEHENNNNSAENGENNSRRFECHYCCRNFPTSQALGGHQNAHKRERQHAKRHLQSAMVQSSLTDGNMYGFMNYRFGSAPSTAISYPTWNSNSSSAAMIANSGGRFYGSSYSQPINGSPLALWRVPTATTAHVQSSTVLNRERSLQPLPLFAGEEMKNTRIGSSRVGASGSQNRYVYDSKPSGVKDHVSLDLRL